MSFMRHLKVSARMALLEAHGFYTDARLGLGAALDWTFTDNHVVMAPLELDGKRGVCLWVLSLSWV